MKHDWKRKRIQGLFTGAMSMYKGKVSHTAVKELRGPDELLSRMTLEEKVSLLGGSDDLAVRAVPRLGIPEIWMSDASSGVRCFSRAAAFPAGIMFAASWDRDLIYRTAEVIAHECRAQGISMILGPGVNIARIPVCGRNFEYFGEDPFLSGDIAVSYIRGVQDHGVIAVVKHFACNNSEYDRHKTDSIVDERTLHEIYLPAFEHAVVRGGVKAVMTSYNPVNGIYGGEHPVLIREILRNQWGFSGITISDWNSLYTAEGSIHHGVDLEMPKARKMTLEKIKRLLRKGRITEGMIDEKVRRILSTCIAGGCYDIFPDDSFDLYSEHNIHRAQEAAEGSIILLKNKNSTLPIKPACRVSVLGRCALDTPTGGGGSSFVPVEPAPGIAEALGLQGIEVVADPDDETIAVSDHVVIAAGFDRFYESEAYDRPWSLLEEDLKCIHRACRLNDSVIVLLHAGGDVETAPWIDMVQAVLFCGYLGMHRGTAPARVITGAVNPSGKLPFTMAQNLMDHPGMEGYPKNPWDISFIRVLGPQGNPRIRKPWPLEYKEGVFVGYRGFDAEEKTPVFPFGHGLSYTTFEIGGISSNPPETMMGDTALDADPIVSITCRITNTGPMAGSEVLQVYVHEKHPKVLRPKQELKGFDKVLLQPGESKDVTIGLNTRAFMYHDGNSWRLNPGVFELRLGSSSRDIIGTKEVKIKHR